MAKVSHIIWTVFLIVSPSYLYYYDKFCHFYDDEVSNITSQASGAVSLMELIGWHNSKGNHRDFHVDFPWCVSACVLAYMHILYNSATM